jgi:broad specificity phosphatase PhoE
MTQRATQLILLRHGRSVWNDQARFQGQSDPPLDEVGREQCRRVAERLAAMGADAVQSSDLARARESAEIIAGPLGLGVELCPDLRERSYGAWEGLTREEVEHAFPESWRQWITAPGTHRPAGGESLGEMTARVIAWLEDVIARHPHGRVVIVSHVGPIKSAVMHFLEIPIGHRRAFVIHNASLTVLSLGADRHTLERLNDTCHLGDLGGGWAI